MTQELLSDTNFMPGAAVTTLKDWTLLGPVGGALRPVSGQTGGVCLTTTRGVLEDGSEAWRGAVVVSGSIEVTPGRRYRLQCAARGKGPFHLRVLEYGGKHSAQVIATQQASFALTNERQSLVFEYTPSADRVAYVRPCLQVDGWLNRAELQNASFSAVFGKGTVSIQANHFITTPGEAVMITLRATAYPVKLLLYGPSGESGPGGAKSGSGAFVDHFKTGRIQEGKAGAPVTFAFQLPPDALEGSYRLVAVEPASGALAATGFNVMPPKGAQEMLALVQRVNLPKGSRLVFLGDSLTANFTGRNYVAIIDRSLRWRFGADVEVINAGIGGNNILQMAARLEQDVLQKNPTHVFVQEGGNSCKRPYIPATGQLGDWVVPAKEYEAAWRDVLTRLAQRKIKVAVMTLVPGEREVLESFEADARNFGEAKNFWMQPDDLRRVVALQKSLAAEFAAGIIDLNRDFTVYMQARVRTGGTEYLHVDDGVHPSEYGSREVAKSVLRYLAP